MQKAIVIHSDILGFKGIITNAENDKNEETVNKLKLVLEESFESLKMFRNIEEHSKIKLNSKFFSDNLYASFSYDEGNLKSFNDAFITSIIFGRIYFENMLNNKIVIRGGISFGNDYSDERMIFSMALVKAYTIECQAVYPRIVIDNELINLIIENFDIPSKFILKVLNNSILKDQNGTYFLNPNGLSKDFNSELNGYRGADLDKIFMKQNIQFANNELKKLNNETEEEKKVVKKYEWFIDILLWNFTDRQNKPKLNSFKAQTF